MDKIFNVSADCKPDLHYMVDIKPKLEKIRDMVDKGQYFTMNRARQYGKTTTLKALGHFLEKDYVVISMDFQLMSYADFDDENVFVEAFAREVLDGIFNKDEVANEILDQLQAFADAEVKNAKLAILFRFLSHWCGQSQKPIVLMIDEVDSATNNQVFLDFLSQLRGYYIKRDGKPTFQSVILAGVYDVKNMKQKISPDGERKVNSPWNIAADFLVDLSFSASDIAGMLREYEDDYHTGMDTDAISQLIYEYTFGYPFLVSRICKLIDERILGSTRFPDKNNAWKKEGVLEAVKILLAESNTLFESLLNKLEEYPELGVMLQNLLFKGKEIVYAVGIRSIEMALMFGFVKKSNNVVVIANRIFETLLYNFFLVSPKMQQKEIYCD